MQPYAIVSRASRHVCIYAIETHRLELRPFRGQLLEFLLEFAVRWEPCEGADVITIRTAAWQGNSQSSSTHGGKKVRRGLIIKIWHAVV